MAEREPGFYWVRPPHDDWIVAEWTIDLGEELGDGGRWYLPANEISRPDYYFAEIGERVERGPKPETNAVYLTDDQLRSVHLALSIVTQAVNLQRWPEPQPIADTSSEGEEIQITPEMIAAGETFLAVMSEPFSLVSELTAFHVRAVYIAMRRLEPQRPSDAVTHYLPLPEPPER